MEPPCPLYSYLRLVPVWCRNIIEMHLRAENSTFVIVASGLEGVRTEMIGPERIWYVNHGTALSALQLSPLGACVVSKHHRNAPKGRKFDFCDCSERIGRCTNGDDWSRTHLVCESWNRLVRSTAISAWCLCGVETSSKCT